MGYKETYNRWLTSDVVDDDTKAELKSKDSFVSSFRFFLYGCRREVFVF